MCSSPSWPIAKNGAALQSIPNASARLSNSEILGRWKAQPSQAGFGAPEVQRVFRAAYRLGRSIHAEEQVLRVAAIVAGWVALTRTGGCEQSPDRHGPEHGPNW